MVAEALKMADNIILVASRHPKAVSTDILRKKLAEHGITARESESVGAALKTALEEAGKNDLICAAGSIFVIAEVVEMGRKGLH